MIVGGDGDAFGVEEVCCAGETSHDRVTLFAEDTVDDWGADDDRVAVHDDDAFDDCHAVAKKDKRRVEDAAVVVPLKPEPRRAQNFSELM